MNRNIDEIYASISKMMIKGIESAWSEAVLEVELHSLAMKLSGGYLYGQNSSAGSFSFEKEDKKILMNDLIELHLKTDLDDESRWNTMIYNLRSSGEYKVKFVWNQTLADDIEKVYAEA